MTVVSGWKQRSCSEFVSEVDGVMQLRISPLRGPGLLFRLRQQEHYAGPGNRRFRLEPSPVFRRLARASRRTRGSLPRACLRREARHVAAGWRQAFGDIIRNAEDHFRAPRLARRNPFFLFGIGSKYEAGVPGRERNLPLWEAKSVARRSHFLRKKSSS